MSFFRLEHDDPLITIITATFNCAALLEYTIRSIREQNYSYIQWVVVDGASTDCTIDLIKKNEDIIDVWVSEADTGIYDAWNKGVRLARGDWYLFLGAGDELAGPDALQSIAKVLRNAHPKHDIVYGRIQLMHSSTREILYEVGEPWDKMLGKWSIFRPKLPLHPETFHHSSLLLNPEPFDPSYRLAGDTHFMMKQMSIKPFHFVPLLVARMALGGASGKMENLHAVSLETRRACLELGFTPPLIHRLGQHMKLGLLDLFLIIAPASWITPAENYYRRVRSRCQRLIDPCS